MGCFFLLNPCKCLKVRISQSAAHFSPLSVKFLPLVVHITATLSTDNRQYKAWQEPSITITNSATKVARQLVELGSFERAFALWYASLKMNMWQLTRAPKRPHHLCSNCRCSTKIGWWFRFIYFKAKINTFSKYSLKEFQFNPVTKHFYFYLAHN